MENLVMYDQLSSYFKGKKIFVTGHTGFKGGWLVACLHHLDAKIKGYALAPEYPQGIFSLLQSRHICESVIADIRDRDRLKEEIISFQPDFIFHLAAQPLVRRSYQIPAETFEVNVTGTANLLESMISLKKKTSVVVITTDKVYENKEKNIFYKEDDSLGGYDPYSASKACTELTIDSFRSSFFNLKDFDEHQKVIASARAGNVIGGGDWREDRLVPDIARSLKQKKIIDVRNPGSVRPWQHVLEPISGYLLLAMMLDEKPKKYSGAYNFGPTEKDHLTVKQLVKSAIENWGEGEWKDTSSPGQLHEAGLLKLDIRKAKKKLGWKPKLNSREAIKWAIEWYKQPLDHQADYTFKQIGDYFSL
jgi:CDP-glucose 4,6-dehydratase